MLRAVGEEEEDGRRPTYEAVAEWLQSVPAGYPTKGPNFGKNTVSRTTDVETG